MTRSRPPQVAFNAGEISPQLAQRFDYRKYQTGLRVCRGFLPTRQGPVTRAPGTVFRGTTKDNLPARRIRFEFAEDDALELEFTNLAMRVWRYGALVMDGASPYELAMPYDDAAIARLSVVQSADVIYMADGVLPIQKLSRLALDQWTIAPFVPDDGPFRLFNLDEDLTLQAEAATGTLIVLTASAALFEADHVGTMFRMEPTDFSQVPGWVGNIDMTVGDKVRYDGNTYELVQAPGQVNTTFNVGVVPPQHLRGTQQVSDGVSWRFVTDTFGIVRIAIVNSPTEALVDVVKALPDGCVDDATYLWAESAWSPRHGFPSVLEIYEQRLVAAATRRDPRTLFFSAAGTTEVFAEGESADDAFTYTVGGRQSVNRILWLKSGSRGLYIGALGEELSTASVDANTAIGPTTLKFRAGSEIGSRPIAPIAFDGNPIFVSKDGSRVFEIEYSLERDRNVPLEISLPSNHLGESGFEQIEKQQAPDPLIWLRRGDGLIVVGIYDRAEDVLGWSLLSVADGFVEDLTVTPSPSGGPDIVTAIVRRVIDGQTLRCVEEFVPTYGLMPTPPPLSEAHHLFCAAKFQFHTPVQNTSVPHLAGEHVYVRSDQGEFGPLTVGADGSVDWGYDVSSAIIGLYDATHFVETLPVIPASPEGSAMGRERRLTAECGVAVSRTADGWIESYTERLGEPGYRSLARDIVPRQVLADRTELFSGTTTIPAIDGSGTQVGVRLGPRGGAPMTVAGLAPGVQEVGP